MANPDFASNFLNITYAAGELDNQVTIRENPGLALYDIKEGGGASVRKRFMSAGARNISGNLADAQTMAASNKGGTHLEWQVPFGETTSSTLIPYSDVVASKDSNEAAAKALELEMDRAQAEAGGFIVEKLFGRTGLVSGIGTYDDDATSTAPVFSLTFNDPSDARNFAPGDHVVIAATATGALVGSTGYVVDCDLEDGYIQLAALTDITTPANPGSWTDDTEFNVFRLGANGALGEETIIHPLESYITATRQTDTFLNVNRGLSSSYSGARLSSAEETGDLAGRAKRLIAKMRGRYGKAMKFDTSCIVMDPEDFATVDEQLNGQTQRAPSTKAEDGYQMMVINSANGVTKFVSDGYKRKGHAFILSKNHLELHSALGGGLLVDFIRVNGQVGRLKDGSNDIEVRTFSRLAHTIGAPYTHGRFSCAA